MVRSAAAPESYEGFQTDEEDWFAEPETRRSSIPPFSTRRDVAVRDSQPPPSIGDAFADRWFR